MSSQTSATQIRVRSKNCDKHSKIVWKSAQVDVKSVLSLSSARVVQEELTKSCGCSHQGLTHTPITPPHPPSLPNTFLPVGVCFDSKFTHSPWCVDGSGQKTRDLNEWENSLNYPTAQRWSLSKSHPDDMWAYSDYFMKWWKVGH